MAEMQPTMEILERIKKNSKENKDDFSANSVIKKGTL